MLIHFAYQSAMKRPVCPLTGGGLEPGYITIGFTVDYHGISIVSMVAWEETYRGAILSFLIYIYREREIQI